MRLYRIARWERRQLGVHVEDLSHSAFVQRAYDDTYALLLAMRDYVSGQSSDDANRLEPTDRVRLSLELSRVTRQITEIMAWLMVQKAIAAGIGTHDALVTVPASDRTLEDGMVGRAGTDALVPSQSKLTFRHPLHRQRRRRTARAPSCTPDQAADVAVLLGRDP